MTDTPDEIIGDDVPDDPLHGDEAHRGWTERCEATDRGDQCMHGLGHDGRHQSTHEWEDAAGEVDE